MVSLYKTKHNRRYRKNKKTIKRRHHRHNQKRGGNITPLPPALVGEPWTPNIRNWPGVDNIPGNRNHY